MSPSKRIVLLYSLGALHQILDLPQGEGRCFDLAVLPAVDSREGHPNLGGELLLHQAWLGTQLFDLPSQPSFLAFQHTVLPGVHCLDDLC